MRPSGHGSEERRSPVAEEVLETALVKELEQGLCTPDKFVGVAALATGLAARR